MTIKSIFKLTMIFIEAIIIIFIGIFSNKLFFKLSARLMKLSNAAKHILLIIYTRQMYCNKIWIFQRVCKTQDVDNYHLADGVFLKVRMNKSKREAKKNYIELNYHIDEICKADKNKKSLRIK